MYVFLQCGLNPLNDKVVCGAVLSWQTPRVQASSFELLWNIGSKLPAFIDTMVRSIFQKTELRSKRCMLSHPSVRLAVGSKHRGTMMTL